MFELLYYTIMNLLFEYLYIKELKIIKCVILFLGVLIFMHIILLNKLIYFYIYYYIN